MALQVASELILAIPMTLLSLGSLRDSRSEEGTKELFLRMAPIVGHLL